MRTVYKPFMWFILLILGIISCQKKEIAPPTPDFGVPTQEMNKRFTIRTTPAGNSFRTKDMVLLSINLIPNVTQDPIAFQFDLDARIYIKQKDQWIEIRNAEIYQDSPVKIILSPTDVWPNDSFDQAFKPELPDVTKTTVVRFILIGNIIKNGDVTEEKTAAYIDITLKP